LRNIEFLVRDPTGFDATAKPGMYDLITTFDAVHDQARPLEVLKGIHRALKADGWYLMQDIRGSSHVHDNIGHPIGTFLRSGGFLSVGWSTCSRKNLVACGQVFPDLADAWTGVGHLR